MDKPPYIIERFAFLKTIPPIYTFRNNEASFYAQKDPHEIPLENIKISKIMISRDDPNIYKIKLLFETSFIYLQMNIRQKITFFLSISDTMFLSFPSLKMAYEFLKKKLSIKYDISFFNVEYSTPDVEKEFKLLSR